MMNTIAQQWELFSKFVMPNDVPEIQRQEMRRAFYGGAESILRLQFAIGDNSEDAGIAMIQGWYDECKLFAQQVAKGEA